MLLLEFGKEERLVSGMAKPSDFQFGIGFATARATSLLVTAKMTIVMNRIVEEWKGMTLKRPPTDFNSDNMHGHQGYYR